jgi:hypothetical protein
LLLSAADLHADPDEINATFDYAAGDHLPAAVIFPLIRTEAELIDQLRLLETGDRWTLSREHVEGLVTDDVLIGIRWRTAKGLISQPMGFGPFSMMPVTRRAPYICLATWPGEHDNPHRKKFEPQTVDFLDATLPEPLSSEDYKAVWSSSTRRTTELLSETEDSSTFYRRVAFRLSGAVTSRL